MSEPLVYKWIEGSMVPVGRFARRAHELFDPGQTYFLGEVEERSEVSHRHEFAWLKEAWRSLPERLAQEYPTTERLRKTALIRTGWCSVQDYVCGSQTEAARWAINLRRELDEYAIIEVSASVVRVYRARSQARGAMNNEDFKASKAAILDWVSALLEVTPAELERASAA